ncbi:MAG: ComEC/Rec2 family competence protein [Thermomicrobiales bacterium]
MPLGLLVGLAAIAGVSLGVVGVVLATMLALGFLLLDQGDQHGLSRVLIAAGIVAATAGLGVLRSQPSLPEADSRLSEADSVVGVVQSMPQPGGRNDTALFIVESVTLPDGTRFASNAPVLAMFPTSLRANVGDRLFLAGEFTPLAGLEPGYRRFVEGREAGGVFRGYGASIIATGSSPLRRLVDARRAMTDGLRRAIPGDAGTLAAGIVTGDDSALSDDTADAFQTAGLSHVTAVSGQNIAILAGLVTLLLRGRARRMLAIQGATILLVWLYVGMTGFGAPAIRAGLFVTFAFAAMRFGRRPDFLTILALTSGGMMLVCPAYVMSVSFWLSMAASAALVTAFGWPSGGVRGWMTRSVAALITAQLATLPISIAVFGMWSVGSIPANLIVAPLMQVAFPLCFLLALSIAAFPWIVPVVAVVAEAPLVATIAVTREIAGVFPQSDLAAGGFFLVLATAIPCIGAIALLSEDARRWGRRFERDVAGDVVGIGAAGAGILVGVGIAIIVMDVVFH